MIVVVLGLEGHRFEFCHQVVPICYKCADVHEPAVVVVVLILIQLTHTHTHADVEGQKSIQRATTAIGLWPLYTCVRA